MSDGDKKGPLARFVPEGKNVLWVGGIVAVGFAAGIGFNEQTSALQGLPQQADSIQTQVDTIRTAVMANTAAVRALEARVTRQTEQTQDELRVIRCLSRLSAEGRRMSAFDLDDYLRRECR